MKTKALWVVAVAGALAVVTLAPAAPAQVKKDRAPAPGPAVERPMKPGPGAPGMPGCGMPGMGKGMGPGGCCMKGGGMGAGMGGCCMKGGGMGPGMGRGMCGPGMGRGMGPGMGFGPRIEMLRELGLSQEQSTRLMDIRDRQARLAIQRQADLRLAALDLRKLMRDEKPDKARIDAQIDKLARLRAELQKARIGALLEVRSVLTPDQLKKWRERPMMMRGEEPEEED